MLEKDPFNLKKRIDFCLTLKGAVETFPFGENFHVMRVGEKNVCAHSLQRRAIACECEM